MPTHIKIGDVSPRTQYVANGTQTEFTYPFPIFEDADLEIYLDDSLTVSGFTISGSGESTGGSVTFDTAPAASVIVTLARRMAFKRTADFLESGELRAKVLNDELDHLTAYVQQVGDDNSRSLQMAITETSQVDVVLPTPTANTALVWNSAGDGVSNGPSVTEIQNAQSYSENASASATASAGSETNAASSATSAQNAAVAAQTAAASNMYASNESKNADFSVSSTDDGKQFLIDTSAGDVTVTLPPGTDVTDGFRIALGKTSADNNAVIATRSGTDTINGGTVWQFSSPHGQSVLTADTTPSPDTWYAAGVGVTSPIGVSDLHDNARPYDVAFIAGFDGTMTAEPVSVQTYGELVSPRGFTLTGEQIYIDTAPTGTAAIFDIEKNGVSVYATKPQVAAAANAGTAGILSTTAISAGDRLTFKCTQVGSITAGSGARFTLAGKLS
ncbi:hypothetical protein V5T82_10930 [Magnetovibrio sp. PR-2]|uniref:hypothetical protein n=1 Tax=Magnetovibrio sp. PR-2 TaxID=3120356 RepID=UPI002FCE2700